ncbi:hypothetical protein HO133_007864 [Letharia lupina]|uniref:Smr domain-containing protein n=1 Tax=Letharia lupina TaxID=560253 RepID=A0A8H6CRZ0_9LECA|nr:uncharacterized protein HO133_007864 [Letharia lupina]KAF6228136.1 hypothetical protein HO133_007864 [Letharia lupina]
MDDIAISLEKEYCPPLDPPLFYSFFLEYADKEVSLNGLRDKLDIVKEITLTTDDAAFDPSGTSGFHDDTTSHESSERAQSWHGDVLSDSTEDTDLTSVSQALDSVNFGGDTAENRQADGMDLDKGQYDDWLESLSPSDKAMKLKDIVCGAKDFDIGYILRKNGNSYHKALDELLTQAHLEEEGLKEKGIEAFTGPMMSNRERRALKEREKRQKRGKRQPMRRTSSTSALESTRDNSLSSNQWLRVDDSVKYIHDRTHVSAEFIRSTYHSSGATLPSTIAALCASKDREAFSNPCLPDAPLSEIEAHAKELSMEFSPGLQYPQALALIKLTYPSTTSARELALALTSSSNVPSTSVIIPQYILRPPSPPSTSPSTPSLPNSYVPLSDPRAAALASIRSNAQTQSRSAFRKSKSDRLMGAAASHYSSVGRDANAALRQNVAALADARVSSQSKPGEVDLHGLNVKDAVRVSRDRVQTWWESEGREWARAGKVMNGGGLRIITGVGRHSAGGRAVLGPAVGRMLNDEGWKVQVGEGLVKVVGRARR